MWLLSIERQNLRLNLWRTSSAAFFPPIFTRRKALSLQIRFGSERTLEPPKSCGWR